LSTVPFYAQEDYECGPAALAMLLQSAGVNAAPADLLPQVYLPGRQGSLQVEMMVAARRHGLPAYLLVPTLAAVLQEVAAGHPVLVFQNLSLPVYPVWHYAVVIGFDRERGTITLHSGRTPRLEMTLSVFERTWARGDHWAMVALPPSTLPATAQATPFAAALAALERNAPSAAQQAYKTALQRWPDDLVLMLGAGNAAYALGQLGEAAAAYQAALQAHPRAADAWNNLAQVRIDQGRKLEARQAIDKALAIGGPRLETYRALADKLRSD
jgi:tetratricopeptide (TPR) repeat protein